MKSFISSLLISCSLLPFDVFAGDEAQEESSLYSSTPARRIQETMSQMVGDDGQSLTTSANSVEIHPSSEASRNDAKDKLAAARVHFLAGEYDHAVELYGPFLLTPSPELTNEDFRNMHVCAKQITLHAAEGPQKEFLAHYNFLTHLKKARRYMESRQYQLALSAYQSALAVPGIDPNSAQYQQIQTGTSRLTKELSKASSSTSISPTSSETQDANTSLFYPGVSSTLNKAIADFLRSPKKGFSSLTTAFQQEDPKILRELLQNPKRSNIRNHTLMSGMALLFGFQGQESDSKTASEYFKEAYFKKSDSNIEGIYMVAALYQCLKRETLALEWFLKAADLGHAESMYRAARLLLDVRSSKMKETERNAKKALELLQRTAVLNHIKAIRRTAYLIEMGLDRKPGKEQRALDYYLKGANLGDARCMSNAGNFYRYGRGVNRNLDIALTFYRKANAANKSKNNKYNLELDQISLFNAGAVLEIDCEGHPSNKRAALDCFLQSAHQLQHIPSMEAAAELLYAGFEGMAPDKRLALMLYVAAAELGQPSERLEEILREFPQEFPQVSVISPENNKRQHNDDGASSSGHSPAPKSIAQLHHDAGVASLSSKYTAYLTLYKALVETQDRSPHLEAWIDTLTHLAQDLTRGGDREKQREVLEQLVIHWQPNYASFLPKGKSRVSYLTQLIELYWSQQQEQTKKATSKNAQKKAAADQKEMSKTIVSLCLSVLGHIPTDKIPNNFPQDIVPTLTEAIMQLGYYKEAQLFVTSLKTSKGTSKSGWAKITQASLNKLTKEKKQPKDHKLGEFLKTLTREGAPSQAPSSEKKSKLSDPSASSAPLVTELTSTSHVHPDEPRASSRKKKSTPALGKAKSRNETSKLAGAEASSSTDATSTPSNPSPSASNSDYDSDASSSGSRKGSLKERKAEENHKRSLQRSLTVKNVLAADPATLTIPTDPRSLKRESSSNRLIRTLSEILRGKQTSSPSISAHPVIVYDNKLSAPINDLRSPDNQSPYAKRFRVLYESIEEDACEGRGDPKPLVNPGPEYENYANLWSRRINKKDRLIYNVNFKAGHKPVVTILQIEGHYND